MNWKPDICVYHGGCDDGFGAAWVVRRRFGDAVHFIPAGYGKPIEWPADLNGKNILFVDFSLKHEHMKELAAGPRGIEGQIPQSIVILDHHKTAEAELKQWNIGPVQSFSWQRCQDNIAQAIMEQAYPIVAHFDMASSGARMAWDFFYETEHNGAPTEFIAYIEDRDLWRFAFGDKTRRFSAALRTYPQTFNVWDQIAEAPDLLIAEGVSILRGHSKNIESFCREAYEAMIGDHRVPVVNVPYHYASDVANALLQVHPKAPFAATWFVLGDGHVQFSLRSEDSRVDVSEVAKGHGGGGHRNAAGFRAPWLPVAVTPIGAVAA